MKFNIKECLKVKTTSLILISIVLYTLGMAALFFSNYQTSINIGILITIFFMFILTRNMYQIYKTWFIVHSMILLICGVFELIWLVDSVYSCYIIAIFLCFATSINTVTIAIIISCKEKDRTEKEKSLKMVISYIKKGLLILLCIIIFTITAILLVTAITPKLLISFIQTNIFPVENSFLSKNDTKQTLLDEEHIYINDLRYGTEYPNSFLDIYISKESELTMNPTYVFIHGGGFTWGDKFKGDPNTLSSGFLWYLRPFLDAGYNVVSLNYAFAPEYKYPTPIIQISQAIEYLISDGQKYGLDMSQLFFGGSSAGGNIAGQFVNIQTNTEYAKEIGIEPVLNKGSIYAVIFNSALLDNERFSKTGMSFIDYLFLQCGRAYFGGEFLVGQDNVIQSNVINNITSEFPPTYISDGNFATFDAQARELHEKLDELGVYNVFNYYDHDEVSLLHGYEEDGSDYASDNLEKIIAFLSKIFPK